MKFLNFFQLLWVIFSLLDPDPDSEYGSVSTDPIESGSATLSKRRKIRKNHTSTGTKNLKSAQKNEETYTKDLKNFVQDKKKVDRIADQDSPNPDPQPSFQLNSEPPRNQIYIFSRLKIKNLQFGSQNNKGTTLSPQISIKELKEKPHPFR